MLLRKITDYRRRLAIGQLCLVLGLIGLLASGTFRGNGVFGLFMEETRLLDFLNGFLTGLSSVLLGISVVFNIAVLRMVKKGECS